MPRAMLVVLALSVLAGWPLLMGKELAGHDSVQYLTQLAELDRVVRDGQLPPRWAPDLDAGRGAPFFAFHPPLLLWMAEAFHLSGLGLIASINLATFGFLVAAAAIMFLFARDRWGERAGLVAAAAYVFAPYTMLNLHVRHAFLELSAFAFLPLAAWGVARASMFQVAAGTALILLSHPAIAPIFLPGLLLYAASRRTLRHTLGGIGLGTLVAAWFIVPAVVEMTYLRIADLVSSGRQHYGEHFASLGQLVWSPWGFGTSVPGSGDGMSFRIGIPHLAAIIASLAALRIGRHSGESRNPEARESLALVGMAGIGVFFATSLSEFLWEALPLLHPIQYPWRALSIVAFASAGLAARTFARWPAAAMFVFVVFGLPLAVPSAYRDDVRDEMFAPERIAKENFQVGTGGLFNPRTAQMGAWRAARVRVVNGDATIADQRFATDRADLVVLAASTSTIELELNHFPGWTARVDGTLTPIEAPGGLIAVSVPEGRHAVHVQYGWTPVRVWTAVISAGTLLVTGPMTWRKRRMRKGASILAGDGRETLPG